MKPWLRFRFILLILGVIAESVLSQSYSLPYKTDGECRFSEYKVNSYCCSKCKAGTRKLNDCTSVTDTECGDCPAGMYSSMNYFPNCFMCSTCPEDRGMEYTKPCTPQSDAKCACKSGWYCVLNDDPCTSCEKHTQCPPGKGAKFPATSTEDVRCTKCPSGTFSAETSTRACQPHTRCEEQGRSVLIQGNATADTVCGPVQNMTLTVKDYTFTPTLSPVSSTMQQDFTPVGLWIGLPVMLMFVVLMISAAICLCRRKDVLKPAVHDAVEVESCKNLAPLCSQTENQGLLADNSSSSDPSSSLSSDSHSQGTGVSQDCLHVEQPSVSSPVVNVSFTATINCQVNTTTGYCSVPISPCVHLPEPEFPLSQEEELCVSCEQEDSKDAIQSVQESGMTKY